MVFCYFEPGEYAQSQFTQMMYENEQVLLHRQEPLHTSLGYRVTITGPEDPGHIGPPAELVVEAPDPIRVALADLHSDIRADLADFIPAQDLVDLPETDRVRLDDDTPTRNQYDDTPTSGEYNDTPTSGEYDDFQSR